MLSIACVSISLFCDGLQLSCCLMVIQLQLDIDLQCEDKRTKAAAVKEFSRMNELVTEFCVYGLQRRGIGEEKTENYYKLDCFPVTKIG